MARVLQFALFITAALLVVVAVHSYFFLRLVRDPALPPGWRRALTVAVIALAASIPLVMSSYRLLPLGAARIVAYPAYIWMGAMLILFTLLAGADLLRGAIWIAGRVAGGALLGAAGKVFAARAVAIGAVAATAVLTAIAAWGATRDIAVVRVEVTLERLPRAFDGYTIAQLTDLHLGAPLGRAFSEEVVARTNAAGADLIAVTGDVVDGSPSRLADAVAPLGGLSALDGVWLVTGNHEYYSEVEEWLPVFARLGMRLLHNERVAIERGGAAFDLAGIDDENAAGMAPGHGPDIGRALAGRDPAREVVLLAHQPRSAFAAARRDVGLVLAGHTHGGQLWPWNHFVLLQQPFVFGLHRVGERTEVYVSEGTGFWGPPLRLGTRSEITLVTLRCP